MKKTKSSVKTKPLPLSQMSPVVEKLNPVKNPNTIVLLLLVIVILFSAYLLIKVNKLEEAVKNAPSQPTAQQPSAPKITMDNIKALFKKGFMYFGNTDKKLLFVEVTDPSCPYCHVAAGEDPETSKSISPQFQYASDGGSYVAPVPEMKKLVDQGKASMVFLYSPGHGNGEIAAQALYCAYDKGKFWEVENKLMSNAGYDVINNQVANDKTKIPVMVDFLSGVIDSNYMSQCLTSGKYAQTLKRDEQVSQSLGYQGTPYFIINTTPFNGAYPWGQMSSVVNKALGV